MAGGDDGAGATSSVERVTRAGSQTVAKRRPPASVAVLCSQTKVLPTSTAAWRPSRMPIAASAPAMRML